MKVQSCTLFSGIDTLHSQTQPFVHMCRQAYASAKIKCHIEWSIR